MGSLHLISFSITNLASVKKIEMGDKEGKKEVKM
jgi:hypothetical protein